MNRKPDGLTLLNWGDRQNPTRSQWQVEAQRQQCAYCVEKLGFAEQQKIYAPMTGSNVLHTEGRRLLLKSR